jgi:histidinol-phosphate aminotransferase
LATYNGNGLSESNFVVGNGATDILRMIAQAFIFDGGESIVCSTTFPLFALLATMYGGDVVSVDPDPGYQMDLTAMANAVTDRTRIVWLCSPNNPTGLVISQQELDEFVEQLPEHVVLVVDEAYFDYVTDPDAADVLHHIDQARHVIAVRSFSKSFGLAGLRVGYAIAHPDIIKYLLHTVLPFNTGAPALSAACASLDDRDFRHRSRELVQKERTFLYTRLSEMGFECLPSQANFVLVRPTLCWWSIHRLLQRHWLMRFCDKASLSARWEALAFHSAFEYPWDCESRMCDF